MLPATVWARIGSLLGGGWLGCSLLIIQDTVGGALFVLEEKTGSGEWV